MVGPKPGENVVLSIPLFVQIFYLKYLKDMQSNINGGMEKNYPVMDFVIGGVAGAGAATITNPLDVVRTRMQLQGELQKRGEHAVHYRGVLHALRTIANNDGLAALYRGIASAVLFQLVGNGIRLGLYQQAEHAGWLRDDRNVTRFWNSLAVAGVSGGVGAAVGSPFLLVKTQLQSAASAQIAVGAQHKHEGTFSALRNVYKMSGVKGLWRGVEGQVMRNSVGSATQIASFAVTKDLIQANSSLKSSNKYLIAFFASNLGAIAKTVTMGPLDVIVTRLYNQPTNSEGKGLLYSGVVDCARKIASSEGFTGFYKGIMPTYFRQAPQSVLLLMFWDILKDLQTKLLSTNQIITDDVLNSEKNRLVKED